MKQSAIYLATKLSGKLDQIETDLKKTVLKDAQQIGLSEVDISSGNYPELKQLHPVRHVQKLVVVFDPLYNASVLINEISELDNYRDNLHVINIPILVH